MAEVLDMAVELSVPTARQRHPEPGLVPGALLGTLVRDAAVMIVRQSNFTTTATLQAEQGPNLSLRLSDTPATFRIRVRKLRDLNGRIPDGQEEFPIEAIQDDALVPLPELALLWGVKDDRLARVVLATPYGWEGDLLAAWYAAVEVPIPDVRRLEISGPVEPPSLLDDDLDDTIERRNEEGEGEEESGPEAG